MAPLVPKMVRMKKVSNPDVWACVTTKKAIPRPSDTLTSSFILEMFFFSLENLGLGGLNSLNKVQSNLLSINKVETSAAELPNFKN